MTLFNNTELSKLLDWVDLEKQAAPGPPPRPGLRWKPQTSRWIRPVTSGEIDDSSAITEKPDVAKPSPAPINLDPTRFQQIETHIKSFENALNSSISSFEALFSEGDVTGRLKDVESASEKIDKKNLDIDDLTDIAGTRIEYPDAQDIKEAVTTIKAHFSVLEEEEHYQKDGYYTATHFLIEVEGKTVEVQVRTTANGKIADYSHDKVYKESESLENDPALLEYVNQYVGMWSDFVNNRSEEPPVCPEAIRLTFTCLEDMPAATVHEPPEPELEPEPAEGVQPESEEDQAETSDEEDDSTVVIDYGQSESDEEDQAETSDEEDDSTVIIERMKSRYVQKNVNKDFTTKAKALFTRLRAPKGHFRLVVVDPFEDTFEADTIINDYVFIEEAQREKGKLSQKNPAADYLIYDEDLKVVG